MLREARQIRVQAERLDLVNRVVPHDELEMATSEWARRLAAKPPLALALAKQALQRCFNSTLDEMLDYEAEAQDRCFRSADALEGTRAFVEKRPPRFGVDE